MYTKSRSIVFTLLACLCAGVFCTSIPAGARAQEAATDSVGIGGIEVAEAAICTAVTDRQPVGAGDRFPADTEQLYCFTDLRGAQGTTVVHAWIHEGTTRARVELPVRGDRWRTWSSKRILPEWTGQWEVKVLTIEGAVLHTLTFTVE